MADQLGQENRPTKLTSRSSIASDEHLSINKSSSSEMKIAFKQSIVYEWWKAHKQTIWETDTVQQTQDNLEWRFNSQNRYLHQTLYPWVSQHPDAEMADLMIKILTMDLSSQIVDFLWEQQQSEILEAYIESIRISNGRQLWLRLVDQKCELYDEYYGGYVASFFRENINNAFESHQDREIELAVALRVMQDAPNKSLHSTATVVASNWIQNDASHHASAPLNLPVIQMFDPSIPLATSPVADSLIPDESYSEPWVRPIRFDKCNTLLVKAYLGTGKSVASKLLVQVSNYRRILILAPRQTYAINIAGEFNREHQIMTSENLIQLHNLQFVNYMDEMQGQNWGQHNRLIVSPESLHRLITDYEPYDLVIADEIESVLKQFSSQQTMASNTSQCAYVFDRIVRDAEKVVGLDAFLHTRSYNVMKKLRRDVRVEINEYPAIPRKYCEFANSQRLFEFFLERLSLNRKIYFFCASKKKALDLQAEIQKHHKDKKGLIYTSDTLGIERRALKEVRQLWGDPLLDYVITTSTNTVGINFDVKSNDPSGLTPFDEIFAYFSANASIPRDGFQNLMRPRHLSGDTLYLYINPIYRGPRDWGSTSQEILTHMRKHEDMLDNTSRQLGLQMKWNKTEGWLDDLHVSNLVEDGQSRRFHSEIVHRYLKICGYSPMDPDLDECEDRMEPVNIAPYESIPDIDESYAKALVVLQKTGDISRDEIQMLDKFFFKRRFSLEAPLHRLKALYITHWSELEGRRWLYNLYDEKNYSSKQVLERDAKRCSRIKSRCQIHAEQRRLIEITNQILKLPHSSASAEFSYESLVSITPEILKLRDQLSQAFELRLTAQYQRLNDSTIAAHLIDKVYSKWCNNPFVKKFPSNRKPIRKKVDGIKIDVTPYVFIGERYEGKAICEDEKLWSLLQKLRPLDSFDQQLRSLISRSEV